MDQSTIGAQIRSARVRKGWSQSELADRLTNDGFPYGQRTISYWEQGTRSLDEDVLGLLSRLLAVDLIGPTRYVAIVNHHIAELVMAITIRPDFDRRARRKVLAELENVQYELLRLADSDDRSLAEKVAQMQASLREIHRNAPPWVMDRIRAMFSESTFAGAMGMAIGSALTKGLW